MNHTVETRALSAGALAFEAKVTERRPAIVAWLREQPVEMVQVVDRRMDGSVASRSVRPATEQEVCGVCSRRRALLRSLGVTHKGLVLLDADQPTQDKGVKWENPFHDRFHLGVGLAALNRTAYETRCSESRAVWDSRGPAVRARRGTAVERAVDAHFGFGLTAEERLSTEATFPALELRGKAARAYKRGKRKGSRFDR